MIKYFKELLKTLKAIEAHLAKIADNTGRVAKCVKEGHRNYGACPQRLE